VDLVPLRAAAGGGTINRLSAVQCVAAGFTLLQRSATLVRALAGRRTAILLSNGPHFLTALAASDGRGAVIIPVTATASEIAKLLVAHNVGAVFTLAAIADRLLDPTVPRVLLDGAPATARVILTPHADRYIDLGSHFGLEISGDDATPGRDEECVLIRGAIHTHRALLESAQRVLREPNHPHASTHHLATKPIIDQDALVRELIAPLMAGARITTA